ncbi:MAG: hypothetical protein HQ567_20530 [Candidatus Nealsonbacteria bacterium]|nr:hypothetical protein [Candidatus Nealsonbacteria bacterium]
MRLSSVVALLCLLATTASAADLDWHDDYAVAYHQAKAEGEFLLIAFHGEQGQCVPATELATQLQPYVLLQVPTTVVVKAKGKERPLMDYGCFRKLQKQPGLAVLNLKYKGSTFGNVVETLSWKDATASADRFAQFLEKPELEFGAKLLRDEHGLEWHTDYDDAHRRAKDEKKLLFLAFDSNDVRFSPEGKTPGMLREFVLARLRVADSSQLLSHTGMRLFHRAPGVGVIDLKSQGDTHNRVVHVLPSEYVTPTGVEAMLKLAQGQSDLPALQWHDDYCKARDAATEQKKMLLIAIDSDEETYTPRPESIPMLHGYVLSRQTTNSEYSHDGKLRRLLEFADFRPMREKPGLVVYDFKCEGQPHYGKVVGAMPYKYLGSNPGNRVVDEAEREREFLVLEPNSLSRRTLTWAIRVSRGHGANQRLRSADGRPDNNLMAGALRNSNLQCRSGVGHFAGGLRGAEIASPGPGKDIVDCALNMVGIWRGSPPHYGVMVRYHREFGYDMAARSSNYWYGTGRF